MNDLTVITRQFNPTAYYSTPIDFDGVPDKSYLDLFDSNGYALCELEKLYAKANNQSFEFHRQLEEAIRYHWFASPSDKNEGAIINHALLFERKGYAGDALVQLQQWGAIEPIIWKVAKIKPKWGLDFSIDYCDRLGRVFEIVHFEYDSFDLAEMQSRIVYYTDLFATIDWDSKAREVWERRAEWAPLEFEEQSAWKTDFFGIERERFKMVLWNHE